VFQKLLFQGVALSEDEKNLARGLKCDNLPVPKKHCLSLRIRLPCVLCDSPGLHFLRNKTVPEFVSFDRR
jgi:hypothetical protein